MPEVCAWSTFPISLRKHQNLKRGGEQNSACVYFKFSLDLRCIENVWIPRLCKLFVLSDKIWHVLWRRETFDGRRRRSLPLRVGIIRYGARGCVTCINAMQCNVAGTRIKASQCIRASMHAMQSNEISMLHLCNLHCRDETSSVWNANNVLPGQMCLEYFEEVECTESHCIECRAHYQIWECAPISDGSPHSLKSSAVNLCDHNYK